MPSFEKREMFPFEMKIDKFCLQQSIKCLSFVGVKTLFLHTTPGQAVAGGRQIVF